MVAAPHAVPLNWVELLQPKATKEQVFAHIIAHEKLIQ
jgi:hypothetical protein